MNERTKPWFVWLVLWEEVPEDAWGGYASGVHAVYANEVDALAEAKRIDEEEPGLLYCVIPYEVLQKRQEGRGHGNDSEKD